MKKYLLLIGLMTLCLGTGSLEALPTQPDIMVHTWGGGALLQKVFNAVSVLLYGKTGFNGLLMFCGLIGGLGALIMAFAKGSWEPLITNWFLPAIVISCLVLAPKDKLYIQDHLVPKAGSELEQPIYAVENVPYFMKLIVGSISTISYKVTQELEKVTHGVDDSTYNWTGHIYAGDTLFQAGKVQINDPFLEQNIHNLVYDCVFNDIKMRIPRYTKKDLFDAKDLLGFIAPRTNAMLSTRIMGKDGEYTPMKCHKAAEKIQEDFQLLGVGGALAHFSQMNSSSENALKSKIYGEISSEANLLKGLKNSAMADHSKLMKQSLMIDSTQKALSPKAYATLKAEQMHKQQQGILGAMGAKSIVAMKNFFEAIVYMSFPIILLLALGLMGFRTILTWLQFLVWISLWPPFFVIVNFLLNTTWDMRVAKVFGGSEVGLSIFSSHGLSDLYSSMESIAAGALFSVPFLAFAIVKGGVGSMLHLASTLNAPAQSAASQAASERVSGNYSAGNIQWQNENISSTSMYQKNENPFLQQGGMSFKQGNMTTSMDSDGTTLQKGMSNIGADVSLGEAYGRGLQSQYSESEQTLASSTQTYNDSWNQVGTTGKNMMDTLSNDHSFSNLTSKSEQDAATELYQRSEQQLQDISNNYGISRSSAIELAAKAGAGISLKGLVDVGGSVNTSGGTSHIDGKSFAERDSEFKSLNDNIQKLQQFTQQSTDQENLSQGQRFATDYGEQLSKAQGYTDQLSTAQSNHASLSKIHDVYQKSSTDGRQNLNNEFTDAILKKYDDSASVNRMLKEPEELQKNIEEFTTQKANKMISSKFDYDETRNKTPETKYLKSMYTNKTNPKETAEIDDKSKGQREVAPTTPKSMDAKANSLRGSVESQVKTRGEIGDKRNVLRADFDYKKSNETIENNIQAQEQIDANKAELHKTKVSHEHKQEVKREAKEYVGKTVAKNTAKQLGKFWDGQKQKAYARSERLKQQRKNKEGDHD